MGKKSKRKTNKQRQGAAQRDDHNNAIVAAGTGVAGATAEATSTERGFILPRKGICNRQDDIERAVGSMVKRPWTYKEMLKFLPHTSQDIMDGKLTFEEFIGAFKPVIDSIEPDRDYEKLAEYVSTAFRRKQLFVHLACVITGAAFETSGILDFMMIMDQDILTGFEQDVKNKISTYIEEEGVEISPTCGAFVRIVRKAVRETHEDWAQRVDGMFYRRQRQNRFLNGRQRQSQFLNSSLVYQLSVGKFEQYISLVLQHFYDKFVFEDYKRRMEYRLNLTVIQISLNYHVQAQKSNCWECMVTRESPKTCSLCGVAKYCCESCQHKAWHEGHKNRCSILRTRKSIMDSSLQAMETGETHGIMLSGNYDYGLLPFVLTDESCSTLFNFQVDGPNMAHFYKNLGRIVRNEWWLYDETDRIDMSYDKDRKGNELFYHRRLSILLCYDYVSYEDENGVSVKEAFPQLTAELNELAGTFDFGTVMSRERFLETFSTLNEEILCARDKEKLRRQAKAYCWGILQDDYHK